MVVTLRTVWPWANQFQFPCLSNRLLLPLQGYGGLYAAAYMKESSKLEHTRQMLVVAVTKTLGHKSQIIILSSLLKF